MIEENGYDGVEVCYVSRTSNITVYLKLQNDYINLNLFMPLNPLSRSKRWQAWLQRSNRRSVDIVSKVGGSGISEIKWNLSW
jgi:hypothetical protein